MNNFKIIPLFLVWVIRTYKLFCIFLVILITHQLYIHLPCFDIGIACLDNNTFESRLSAFISMLGAVIVLLSINSNLSRFKGVSFFEYYKMTFRTNPFIQRETHAFTANASIGIGANAVATMVVVEPPPATIDELYKHMEKQFIQQRNQMKAIKKGIETKLSKQETKLNELISESHNKLSDLNNKVEHFAIGSIDWQVFGVLLVFYGSYLNLT